MRGVLLFFFLSCSNVFWAVQLKDDFRLLDKFLFTDLDSSKAILCKLTAKKNHFTNTQKGELCSKWGIYYALSGNNARALSSFWEAYSFTGKNSRARASMLKNLANVYKALADYNQTDKMLKASLYIYRLNGMKLEELIILGELASSAYYQMRWERAIYLNLKVISSLKKLNDKKFLAIQQQRLANIYYSLDKYAAAIEVYRESMHYYDSQPNELLNSGYIRIALGDSYFQSGDYKRAAFLYLNAARKLQKIDISKYWLAKSKLAQTYLEQGIKSKGLILLNQAYLNLKQLGLPNLDESLTYLLRNATLSPQNKVFLLNELNHVFTIKASGVPFNNISWSALLEEASQYYARNRLYQEQVKVLSDLREVDLALNKDLHREKSERLLENEVNKQEKLKAKALQTRVKYYKTVQGLWVISIAFLLAIGGFLYYYYTAKVKDQKIRNLRLKLQNVDLEERLELERKNVLLEQELHAVKERELAALSLQLYQLQESMNAEIKTLEAKSEDPNVKTLQKRFKSAMKQKDYWKEFEMKFIQINPEFHKKLFAAFPQLTKKDLDFCALVRLNLSNKEIASLTQISYESVISKKYKLRKKIDMESENELVAFLQQL